jgi:hypothetical protein
MELNDIIKTVGVNNMKQKIIVVLVLFFGLHLSAQAGNMQITGTDQTIGFSMSKNIHGPLGMDASYSHNFVDSSQVADAGLNLSFGGAPFSAMVGLRVYYSEVNDLNGTGLAPGVGVGFAPFSMLSFNASYYYSDDRFTSDDDIKNYHDWSVTANFHPGSAVNMFVGYGYKTVEMADGSKAKMYDGVVVGASVGF